jgi:hypothetical protein
MITRQLSRRIERIEERLCPRDEGRFTLEELCRAMWRIDPGRCIEISREPGAFTFRTFVPLFQAEEAGGVLKPAQTR